MAIRQKELEDPVTGGKIFFQERAAYEWLHGDEDGACTDYSGDGADNCTIAQSHNCADNCADPQGAGPALGMIYALPLIALATSLLDLLLVVVFQKWLHPWNRILAQSKEEKTE